MIAYLYLPFGGGTYHETIFLSTWVICAQLTVYAKYVPTYYKARFSTYSRTGSRMLYVMVVYLILKVYLEVIVQS